MELTEEQRAVVEIDSGRHMVLAPPGTGKTEMLTRRVIRALEKGVDPKRMFCGTFTVRAAAEMSARVREAAGPDAVIPDIGNIHHFCHTFLFRSRRVPQSRQVMDESFMREMVGDCLDEVFRELEGLEEADCAGSGDAAALEEYRRYREEREQDAARRTAVFLPALRTLAERAAALPPVLRSGADPKWPALSARLFEKYRAAKERLYVLDFDDLMIETWQRLKAGRLPDAERFTWVQIDEVQDMSALHWAIIRMLTAPDAVFVFFGDYEQSIFSFMGASPGTLEKVTGKCCLHFFRTNFRATSYLLDLLIRYAFLILRSRFAFVPFPHRYESGAGCLGVVPYPVRRMAKRAERAKTLAAATEALVRRQLTAHPDERVAVLVQTNAEANDLADRLGSIGGVVRISGTEFTEAADFRDLSALFEVTANPFSRPGWARLLRLYGGTRVETMREGRRLCEELFGRSLVPGDLLGGDDLFAESPLRAYARFAREGRIVVFDTETTGLNTRADDIIQLAAAEYVRGVPGRSLNLFLKNTRPILPAVEAVHHISQAKLDAEGVDPAEGLRTFLDFLGTDSLLVAHNLRFDREMLIYGCARHGVPFDPKQVAMCDTLRLVRQLYPKLTSYRLGHLLEELKLAGTNSHDALDDVLAAGELMLHLARKGERVADSQDAWRAEHADLLKTLRRRFAPTLTDFRLRIRGQRTFRQEAEAFLGDRISEGTEAFLKWTDRAYAKDPRPFRDILYEDWETLSKMKNADLLLGDERIVVSTVHKAKGLQFDTVLVPDADQYPSYGARMGGARTYEENARLLYVAMSRAKKRLFLMAPTETGGQEGDRPAPMPFIDPLRHCFDPDYVDFFLRFREAGREAALRADDDWLPVLFRLTEYARQRVCPPDAERYFRYAEWSQDAKAAAGAAAVAVARGAARILRYEADASKRDALFDALLKGSTDRFVLEEVLSAVADLRVTGLLRAVRAVPVEPFRVAPEVALAAVRTLEALASEPTVRAAAKDALGDALYDPDGRVRAAAASALARLGDRHWIRVRGHEADWKILGGLPDLAHRRVVQWKIAHTPATAGGYRANLSSVLESWG